MLTARTSEETIQGVPGIRFRTNAEPKTGAERQLQEIQSVLADGMVRLPSPTTLPHLNFYEASVVDGPDKTYISLWVPREKRLHAVELIEAAGFSVSDG